MERFKQRLALLGAALVSLTAQAAAQDDPGKPDAPATRPRDAGTDADSDTSSEGSDKGQAKPAASAEQQDARKPEPPLVSPPAASADSKKETEPEETAQDSPSDDDSLEESPGKTTSAKARESEPKGKADAPLATEKQLTREKKKVESRDPDAGLDQTGTPPLPPKEGEEEPPEKWEENYDGRDLPARGEDTLIWIPRAPLYPVHFVLNYGIRWPIVHGLAAAEEAKLFNRIEDFFTFADGRAGLFPVAFYDSGRGFWGGANFFFNDWGVKGHSFRATGGIGSNNWVLASAEDSWKVFDDDRGTLRFKAQFHRDPTFAFTGIGPDTDIKDEVFFGEEKIEGQIELEVDLDGLNRFKTHVNFRQAELNEGRAPSISSPDSPFDTNDYTGFGNSFFIGGAMMKLDLDTRYPKTEFVPGSGVRLESWVHYGLGPGDVKLSFFRYGTNPKLMWDISGANHVLEFSAHAEALSKTGGRDVPLNELVTLGGSQHLRGFLPGRFRGQSSLVYSIDYGWPLLAFADAILFAEMGNAFNGFYEDFSHDKMVVDWGTGIRSSFSRELQLWIAVGFGTNQINRWSDDFNVDKVRFFTGVTRAL